MTARSWAVGMGLAAFARDFGGMAAVQKVEEGTAVVAAVVALEGAVGIAAVAAGKGLDCKVVVAVGMEVFGPSDCFGKAAGRLDSQALAVAGVDLGSC